MKYLDYYTKPDANADRVIIGLTDLAAPPMTGTMTGSDAALTTAAVAASQTTWDENTICSVYALTRKPA